MTLVEHLVASRELLTGGWSEPFSRGSDGTILGTHDEGIYAWSVLDALLEHGPAFEAWEALERVACPSWSSWLHGEAHVSVLARAINDTDLQTWLEKPGRKVGEVLGIFDAAIARAASKS